MFDRMHIMYHNLKPPKTHKVANKINFPYINIRRSVKLLLLRRLHLWRKNQNINTWREPQETKPYLLKKKWTGFQRRILQLYRCVGILRKNICIILGLGNSLVWRRAWVSQLGSQFQGRWWRVCHLGQLSVEGNCRVQF